EVGARLATTVRSIVCLFPAKPRATEFVLIATFALLEVERLVISPTRGKRRTIDIGCTGPNALPTGARRTNVVVHLPTWTETIAFIGRADCVDHFTPHGVAKVGKTVERLQGAPCPTESPSRLCRRAGHLG